MLEKDSNVKIVKQLFFSFFHAGCHVRLVFYPSQPHMGPIWLLKWSILAFSEKLKSLKLIFKNPWVKNVKIKFLLHTIQRLTQEDYFAHMTYFPGHSKKCVMHIDKFQIFHFFHFWKITHQSLKKVCDEVSKIKIVKQIFFSFFHAGRHGRLVFYPNRLYVGPIWLLKWSILAFSEKLKSLKLIFKNPWVKNPKIQILLHTICRLVQDNHFAPRTFFLCRSD